MSAHGWYLASLTDSILPEDMFTLLRSEKLEMGWREAAAEMKVF